MGKQRVPEDLGKGTRTDAQQGGAKHKENKRPVVPSADRRPHPRTVVVELIHAVVVRAAVVRPRGLVLVNRVVPLHRDLLLRFAGAVFRVGVVTVAVTASTGAHGTPARVTPW